MIRLSSFIRFHLFAATVLSGLSPHASAEPEARWFKGNTHTHSLWSDGNDFPEMIVAWYHEHGYDFLAISDHNVLNRGERWIPVADVEARRRAKGVATMTKYQ